MHLLFSIFDTIYFIIVGYEELLEKYLAVVIKSIKSIDRQDFIKEMFIKAFFVLLEKMPRDFFSNTSLVRTFINNFGLCGFMNLLLNEYIDNFSDTQIIIAKF